MKIGKIVDIHPADAYHCDLEFLLGTLWDISEMKNFRPDDPEYLGGVAYYAGYNEVEFPSNWIKEEKVTTHFSKADSTIFHAVKFETVE